tara:strand:- start:2815 stop:3681 length:867 start_codon:yes stop_codon:yes gene_type:complete
MLIVCLLFLLAFFNTKNAHSQDKANDDPWESANRTIFEFNNRLDDYLFTPIAKAWREIPDIPRKPIVNAANMAKTPINLGNAILQLNKESIGDILGRFIINMTFGLGGIFDVASTQEFGGVKEVDEDFGQTLGYWGVPEGPYVMLPIFGPSTVRDSLGMGVDTIVNPLSFAYRMNGIGYEGRLSGPVFRGVDTREKYLDYVEEIKESSLDYYATMKSLYKQKRRKDIFGEMEDVNLSIDLLPIDIYDEPELESIITSKTTSSENFEFESNLPSSNYPEYNELPISITN